MSDTLQSHLFHTTHPQAGLQLSFVIPMKNEAGNVLPLVEEIVANFVAYLPYEIILIDDQSTDSTAAEIEHARAQHPTVRYLSHNKGGGKSPAQHTGILAARSPICITLDGDGQNDPADVPALVDLLKSTGFATGLVAGERMRRQDTLWKKFGSRFGNTIRQALLHDGCRDTGCGVKVFWRDAYLMCPYFDHSHRFMPALFKREGFNVLYRDVKDRPRGFGVSKLGNFKRLLVSIPDLVGVVWLLRRRRVPIVTEII